MKQNVILDTNVLVSGLRSQRGASFRLLELIGTGRFEISLSVPLVLEYEEVLLRQASKLSLSRRDIRDFLDYLCSVAQLQSIFFLWRPKLPDPDDDMALEVAVAAGAQRIVTFNHRDFAGAEQFRIHVLGPREFLKEIGELK